MGSRSMHHRGSSALFAPILPVLALVLSAAAGSPQHHKMEFIKPEVDACYAGSIPVVLRIEPNPRAAPDLSNYRVEVRNPPEYGDLFGEDDRLISTGLDSLLESVDASTTEVLSHTEIIVPTTLILPPESKSGPKNITLWYHDPAKGSAALVVQGPNIHFYNAEESINALPSNWHFHYHWNGDGDPNIVDDIALARDDSPPRPMPRCRTSTTHNACRDQAISAVDDELFCGYGASASARLGTKAPAVCTLIRHGCIGGRLMLGTEKQTQLSWVDRMVLEMTWAVHEDLKSVVEFGTAAGVTSMYLGVMARLRGGEVHTYDFEDLRPDTVKAAWLDNVVFWQKDLLVAGGNQDVITKIKDLHYRGHGLLFLIDNGKKLYEFCTYGVHAAVGDVALIHDVGLEMLQADIQACARQSGFSAVPLAHGFARDSGSSFAALKKMK